MNPLEQQIHEEETRSYEIEQAQKALSQGIISQDEYDTLLKHHYGQAEPERTHWPLILAAIAIIGVFGIFTLWGGAITGFVTFDMASEVPGGTYTNSTSFVLEADNTTTITVSGSLMNGTANIQAYHDNELFVIWQGVAEQQDLWLHKKEYGINETITAEINNLENYTLWLVRADGSRSPTNNNFSVQVVGEYILEALTHTKKEEIRFVVANETSDEERVPQTSFTRECEDTCELPSGMSNPEIIITLSEGATLNISQFHITKAGENNPPEQTQELPTIIVNETATINLDDYFVDPDGEGLTYDISVSGVEVDLVGGLATFNGVVAGEYTGTLYVSDLRDLLTTTIVVQVLGEEAVVNETTPVVNETINVTGPVVNETTTVNETTPVIDESTGSCSNPNINLRAPECFGDEFDLAFQEVTAPLRDLQQNTVGRFTRLGSLVIQGVVVQETTNSPGANDFRISHTTREGFSDTTTATAWIDSTTGDLHLRGQLYQEQITLEAPQYNSYVVSNANGIVLGYFDRRTGDLHLKGHVVQLGRP